MLGCALILPWDALGIPKIRILPLLVPKSIKSLPKNLKTSQHNTQQEISRAPLVYETYRLVQTILFLTDSVFRVLFAYFNDFMASIGGYEP